MKMKSIESETCIPNKTILSDTVCSHEQIKDLEEDTIIQTQNIKFMPDSQEERQNLAKIPSCKSRRSTQGIEIQENTLKATHLTFQTNPYKSFTMNNLDNSYPNEPISPSKYEPYRKTILDEIEIQEDCKMYRNREWSKTKLMLIKDNLTFFECTFLIKDINKIKILPFNDSKKCENIIKISKEEGVHMFSMNSEKKIKGISPPFFVFSRIIEKKLQLSDVSNDEIWSKVQHQSPQITNDSFIYGEIFKKSQVLGNWESRFIVVKKDGIYSYPDNNSPTHTFSIESKSIKYIWTRFDLHQGFLIVKVKHSFMQTEFALPFTKFSERDGKNWLYSFYRVIQTSE